MAEKVKLSTSQVLKDLENGLTRDEIKEKYSLDSNSMKKLFNTPSLKGRRTQKAPLFELVDDVQVEAKPNVPERAAATATTKAEPAPKKKASTAKITSAAPTVATAKEEVKEEEVILEEEEEAVAEVVASPIAEVSMPDDNVETKEPTEAETKKGLW